MTKRETLMRCGALILGSHACLCVILPSIISLLMKTLSKVKAKLIRWQNLGRPFLVTCEQNYWLRSQVIHMKNG